MDEVLRVTFSAFAHWDGERRGRLARALRDPAEFGRRVLRVGLVDGRMATALEIVPWQVRIGQVGVKAGGIGNVAVNRELQGRGLGTRMMDDTVRFLCREGFDLVRLGGYMAFYSRFGWSPHFRRRIRVWRDDRRKGREPAPGAGVAQDITVRPFQESDRGAWVALYESFWAERTGSVVLDSPLPDLRHPDETGTFILVAESRGALIGYVAACRGEAESVAVSAMAFRRERRAEAESTAVCAMAFRPERPEIYGLLLHHVLERGRGHGVKELVLTGMPYDHELLVHLAPWRLDCEIRDLLNTRNGTMVRIMDLPRLFRKMAPELSRRLAGSGAAGWQGRIRVTCETGGVTLSVADGAVQVENEDRADVDVCLSQSELVRLVLVSGSFRRMGLDRRCALGPSEADVIEALFPLGYPCMGFG